MKLHASDINPAAAPAVVKAAVAAPDRPAAPEATIIRLNTKELTGYNSKNQQVKSECRAAEKPKEHT